MRIRKSNLTTLQVTFLHLQFRNWIKHHLLTTGHVNKRTCHGCDCAMVLAQDCRLLFSVVDVHDTYGTLDLFHIPECPILHPLYPRLSVKYHRRVVSTLSTPQLSACSLSPAGQSACNSGLIEISSYIKPK